MYYGVLLLAIAALLFGVMAVTAKRVSAHLPAPEIAFVRFAIGLAACVVIATRRRFVAHNWGGLIMRGIFGGTAVYLYFLAMEHLSVGVATLLNYTSPIFTALWAALFLGEHVRGSTLSALVLTSVGVVLVLTGNAPVDGFHLGRWQLAGLCSAILSGAAVATIRELRKTDGAWEIFLGFCLVGCAITAIPVARHYIPPAPHEWVLLAIIGGVSIVGQMLMTYALRYVRAAFAGVIAQLTPVSTILFGVVFFGDHFSGRAVVGALVTLVGVTLGAWVAAAPRQH